MGKIKTTITINDDLWEKFSICVIKGKGYRKKNDVIEGLIREYVKEKGEKIDE